MATNSGYDFIIDLSNVYDWEVIKSDAVKSSGQFFGLDLWAEVCEQSTENYVCASCGVCPRSDGSESCIRCSRK